MKTKRWTPELVGEVVASREQVPPITYAVLGEYYGVSTERIRQIYAKHLRDERRMNRMLELPLVRAALLALRSDAPR